MLMFLKICLCFCKYSYKLLPLNSFLLIKSRIFNHFIQCVIVIVSKNKIQTELYGNSWSASISNILHVSNIKYLTMAQLSQSKSLAIWLSDKTWRTHKKCILCKFIIKPRESKALALTFYPWSWHIFKLNKI